MKLLIIGGDSHIGKKLCSLLSSEMKVYTTTRSKDNLGPNTYYLDLENVKDIDLNLPIIDAVLILASINNFKFCQDNPELTLKVNFENTYEIIKKYTKIGVKVYFVSTGSVFSTNVNNYESKKYTLSKFLYPRSKQLVEQVMHTYNLIHKSSHTIIRLSKVISSGSPLISNWLNSKINKKDIICFDRKISPISLDYASINISKIILSNAKGIYHLSGDKLISYNDLAKDIFTAMKSKNTKFTITKYDDFNTASILDMRITTKKLQIYPQKYENFINDLLSEIL